MSKSKTSSKAKTASKNNPEGRGQIKAFLHQGKKIKPVKLVLATQSFFAAEYEETGELVMDSKGLPMPWGAAKNAG
ncbi:MAG: hypothetical protein H6909_04810 [Rickettsiaceae bacterium]|nr:hypothetical protein [Rickettsiaceae bacterium]